MKTTMRRLIALVMVLSMCTGIFALPAAAEETEPPAETTTTVTVEIKDSSGAVIGEKTTTTTTGESGTTVSETATTTTTGESGTVTNEQTTTTTTDPSGTLVSDGTSQSSTQVETTKTETGGTTTDTDKTWESTDTEYDPVTEETLDEDTTQKTEGTTQTVVEGSSENIDNAEPIEDGTHYFGIETGSETTTVTDTSTTTTTKTGQELTSKTDDAETLLNDYQQYGDWSEAYILDKEGPWEVAPDEDIPDPNGFEKIPGSESKPVSTQKEEDLVKDPLAKTDVELEMNAPRGNQQHTYSEEEEVKINLKDLIPKESDKIKHVYENGVLVGYITYSQEKLSPDNQNHPIVPDGTPKTDEDYKLVDTAVEKIKPDRPKENKPENNYTTIDTQITELPDGFGYHVVETKVVTTPSDEDLDPLYGDQDEFVIPPVIPDDAIIYSDNSYIQLPKRTEESEITDPSGQTTKVTVEELRDEKNVLIGYKTTTSVTDKDGNLVSRESVSEYGSITTFTSTTTRDPDTNEVTIVTESTVIGLKGIMEYTARTVGHKDINTTRKADQDIYHMVNTEEGLVFLYKGKMYRVIDNSMNTSNRDVAITDTVNVNSFIDGSGEGAANDLRTSAGYDDGYYTGGKKNYNVDGAWTLTGHGLFSDLRVEEVNGSEHTTKQFEIQKRNADGTIDTHYVYCVEMGTNLSYSNDYDYGLADYYTSDNQESSHPWVGATGTIAQLRSVALNGFWGTEEGLGSLQAVKDLMRRNGVAGWESLTPGMAVTATQVAIWEFGAAKKGQFGGEGYWEPANYEFIYMDGKENGIDDDKMKIVEDLRDLLVKLAKSGAEGRAEELDGSDVVGGAITLKNKISDGKDDADTYNTDISFTLDVSTSSLNGDLKVTVLVDGKEVGKARLAGNDSQPNLFNFGRIYPVKDEKGDYVYTIKDVELAAGVVVDLKLSGTQHLDDGVYIFENSTWQDFIGLSTLERNVDMTISMEFEVKDPQITHEEQSWKEIKTDKEGYVRTDEFHKERTGTETDSEMVVTTKLYGTTVQTDVTTTVTKVERDWESYYDYTVLNLSDAEVDPADPPKTGDTTLILALVSLFSGCGMVLMNRKKEDE